MKKIFLIFGLFMAMNAFASEQNLLEQNYFEEQETDIQTPNELLQNGWVRPRVFVRVQPMQVYAEVLNPYNAPIICNGRIEGVTRNGRVFYSYINGALIYPGNFIYLYINTHPRNPFVRAYPQVSCFFERY